MEGRMDLIFYVINLCISVISVVAVFQPQLSDSSFSYFCAIDNCEIYIA